MIYTVTLNPSLDKTLYLAGLKVGKVNRASSTRVDPGGKGINVARALVNLGVECAVMGFAGGATGELLGRELDALGITHTFSQLASESRLNITVADTETHLTTKLNEPGPTISDADLAKLEESLVKRIRQGDLVAFCGSLPPGAAKGYYARLIQLARRQGAACILDTSGDELIAGSCAAPEWLKPNLEEAHTLTGIDTGSHIGWLATVAQIHAFGVQYVLMTAGEQGVVFSYADEAWHAQPPEVNVSSTVGAGDASLAGALYAWRQGLPGAEIAKWSAAAGTAAVELEGSLMPSLQQVQRVYQATNVTRLA